MFCGKCGAPVPDGAAFCPGCGNPVRPVPPAGPVPPVTVASPAPRRTKYRLIGLAAIALAVLLVVVLVTVLFGGRSYRKAVDQLMNFPGIVSPVTFFRGISALLHRSRYLHRYLTDLPFRTRVSLYLSLGINLLYAVLKLFLGVRFRSVWFGTLGVYYALLTAMRFLLLCHTRRSAFGAQLIPEWKRYRLCGAILIPMTVALAGVVILMLENRESFQYPGYLIYVAAMYAFYASISAAVRLVRYRQYQSPVMTAAKAISLVSALVSMLSLEAAMLTQFGGRDDEAFRQIMLAATGAGVCSIILVMAAYMLIHGARQLGKLPAGR